MRFDLLIPKIQHRPFSLLSSRIWSVFQGTPISQEAKVHTVSPHKHKGISNCVKTASNWATWCHYDTKSLKIPNLGAVVRHSVFLHYYYYCSSAIQKQQRDEIAFCPTIVLSQPRSYLSHPPQGILRDFPQGSTFSDPQFGMLHRCRHHTDTHLVFANLLISLFLSATTPDHHTP
ncbi:hypothetical protein GBA52_000483 [Prunus armeniaca]|nr:hypothetical protein GBA52_000483 [Prunus armeniaca]